MTGRAFRDASEPDEGSMTNPSEAMIELADAAKVFRDAVHSCQSGDTIARCDQRLLIAIDAAMQQAATPAAPVQDDDLLTINEFVQKHASVRDLSVRAAFRRIEARLTPDRVTPLVEALRRTKRTIEDATEGEYAFGDLWRQIDTALREGGFGA